jgi:hypothetical protein
MMIRAQDPATVVARNFETTLELLQGRRFHVAERDELMHLLIISDLLLPLVMAFATAQPDLDVTGFAGHGADLKWEALLLAALRTGSGIGTRRVGHWRGDQD